MSPIYFGVIYRDTIRFRRRETVLPTPISVESDQISPNPQASNRPPPKPPASASAARTRSDELLEGSPGINTETPAASAGMLPSGGGSLAARRRGVAGGLGSRGAASSDARNGSCAAAKDASAFPVGITECALRSGNSLHARIPSESGDPLSGGFEECPSVDEHARSASAAPRSRSPKPRLGYMPTWPFVAALPTTESNPIPGPVTHG